MMPKVAEGKEMPGSLPTPCLIDLSLIVPYERWILI